MIEGLIARFGIGVFKYGAVAFAVVASFVAFKFNEQHKGAVNAVAEINTSNNKAVAIGTSGARKSADDGVRGQVDPSTRYGGPSR